MKSKPNNNIKNNLPIKNKIKQKIDISIAGPGMEMNRLVSAETTLKMHDEYSGMFTGTECFKGTFSLWIKGNVKPYEVPPRHVAYALQKTFKKDLARLQHQILKPLWLHKTAEQCESFVIVLKPNSIVHA